MEEVHIQLELTKKHLHLPLTICGHDPKKLDVLRKLVLKQKKRAMEEAARLQALGFNVCAEASHASISC
jgi:D-tyrosyl-tRNA(Tyr) deacylase